MRYALPMHPLDAPSLSQRYFFPRESPPPAAHVVEVDGLKCARFHVSDDAPTLLHFHGNGEVVADYFPEMAERFASLGWNVFFAEFRGYGESAGRPTLVEMLDDVGPLVDACAASAKDVVVFGRSVGSVHAIEAVTQRPTLAGLVIESGIHDLHERVVVRQAPEDLGLTPDELRALVLERFDHGAKIAAFNGELLVMHTQNDHIVGAHHARSNFSACGHDRKQLVLFDEGDHNSIFPVNAPEYLASLGAFLGRCRPD